MNGRSSRAGFCTNRLFIRGYGFRFNAKVIIIFLITIHYGEKSKKNKENSKNKKRFEQKKAGVKPAKTSVST